TSTKKEGLANTTRAKATPDTSESAKVARQRREAHRQRKEDSPQQPHRWQLSLSGGCTSTNSKSSSNSSTTSIISSGSEPAEAQRHRRTSRQVSQYVWRTVRERTYTFLLGFDDELPSSSAHTPANPRACILRLYANEERSIPSIEGTREKLIEKHFDDITPAKNKRGVQPGSSIYRANTKLKFEVVATEGTNAGDTAQESVDNESQYGG
ncbi:hypothetical protein ALC57_04687, partial [Trachymyrmex cornetzi]